MIKIIRSDFSVKKAIVILLLIITAVFVVYNKNCFLYQVFDRIDITKNNPQNNLTTQIKLAEGSELSQPFYAKTDKIETFRLYFLNEYKYKTNVKVKVYVTDTNNKILGKPTTLTSEKIAHRTGTQILVNGNNEDANENGILTIKKDTKQLNDVAIVKGKTYFLHVKVEHLDTGDDFGIFLSKPGKMAAKDSVIIDGNKKSGHKLLYSATYYRMSYKLMTVFLFLILLTILFVLIPLSRIEEKLKKNHPKADLNKLLLRLMFVATPLFIYYDLSKIASYSTKSFIIQLISIKGALNLLIIGMVWWLIYALCNRIRSTIIASTVLGFIFGLANYLLILFRNSPLLAMDLFSWKTGLAVAGTYTVTFNKDSLWFIVLTMIWICIAFSLKGHKGLSLKYRIVCFVLLAGWCTAFYQIIFNTDILLKNDIKVNQFNPNWTYKKNGYALSFAASVKSSVTKKPEGYDPEEIEKISKKYRSDKAVMAKEVSKKTPNIIVIMNESFSDLRYIGDFETNRNYMPFVQSLKENTIKGTMHMSVLGSRTANSELEFLTGNTMQFFPDYSVPYVSMITEKKPAMPWNMKKLGYKGIIAFHPGMVDSYNRNNVYPLLGFQKHISIEDLKDPEIIRDYVSDSADYDTVIREYEKNKMTKKPLYLFNVTIQNHGGYTTNAGVVDAGISISDTKLQDEQAVQYLNLIKKSDEAVEKLITYFSTQNEPTVIVFYGDHEPVVGSSFYSELYNKQKGLSYMEMNEKKYRVPFFIWANYDIKEKSNVETSANYLQANMMNTIGLPLTGYQKYLLDLEKDLPVISGVAAMDSKHNLFDPKESDKLKEKITLYEKIQYNNFNDDENRIDEFYKLK